MASKAVIFDFDGVIIDSIAIQRLALVESHKLVVGENATPPSFDEFLSHSGDSLDNIFRNMNLPLEMISHYRNVSRNNLDAIKVFDGMHDLLAGLNSRDIKCGICTGKDRMRTIEILKHQGLFNFFQVIVCSDDVTNPKPHPESLLQAIQALDVHPDNAVMIGDAPNDIRCARAAGVVGIAVSWGEASSFTFSQCPPDRLVASIVELHSCILEILI